MWIVLTLASLLLILLVLVDSFEAIVLPRRVTHRYRFARLYYRSIWWLWRWAALRVPAGKRREALLALFGPLSLLVLFVVWAFVLIVGFALLHWSLGTRLRLSEGSPGLATYLYWSGGNFFTLGYGDVVPASAMGRVLGVVEAGLGFGFLAVMISYLPVVYQTFSQRESAIALLDARAGSPPTAAEILIRPARSGALNTLDTFLEEWERWSAELLESHLSFPVLVYYRSQHDNQSWLSGLTAVLDACALLIAGAEECSPYQAQLTFAMARHAVVDLALIFKVRPDFGGPDRLPPEQLRRLRIQLAGAGLALADGPAVDAKLAELRGMYEPFVRGLSERFLFNLPPVFADQPVVDNWQRSAWMRRPPGIGRLPTATVDREHFE
jgi:Ion channel